MMYLMAAGDLGTRIRRARERRRWKQTDLAEALGVSVRTVGSWERGEVIPRSSLGALESVFGVDLTTPEDRDAEVYTDPTELRIWEDETLGPPAARRELIAILRSKRQEHTRSEARSA